MKLIVTGGAGFIGSAVIRYLIQHTGCVVVNLDALTYAGNQESLASIAGHHQYLFEKVNIRDFRRIKQVFSCHQPDAVMHLAAESHVDRSIDEPADFVQTNIIGTYNLLEAARSYWVDLPNDKKNQFRFHHISTDEVYGSLGSSGLFKEASPYLPNSPYAASKASSNHLVRAWYHTYGLPVVITNCSNNYGPYQFPEKLIPLVILNALEGKSLPIYGKGDNVRDWLYVEDHVTALWKVLIKGKLGETYNIGGFNEKTNLEVVHALCDLLDELVPDSPYKPHASLISYVADRPGHDQRYAIDAGKIAQELEWAPRETFATGLRKTVLWYLENKDWCRHVQDGSYRRERLGTLTLRNAILN